MTSLIEASRHGADPHGKRDDRTQPRIELEGLAVTFHAADGDYCAVGDIEMAVDPGRFVAVIGPTGCGKSTILNSIAGLLTPTEGAVRIDGSLLRGINRQASYMFQQDALLPWKTMIENIALGLEYKGVARRERTDRARDWIARVGLTNFESAYPYQLSGGMRKRASIAQAWIVEPTTLLMDEPFAALDAQTKQLMAGELLSLWTDSSKTVLLVTHDLDEAISLADEVVLLSAGPRSTIVGRYEINIERPRDLLEIRSSTQFVDTYRRIWADLKGEVMKSYDRNFSRGNR